MQRREAEWLHIFHELLDKDFPLAAAGLWLDVLNQKLYWVDPPQEPLPGSESAESLTKDVEPAIEAASDFLGQAAAKITSLASDQGSDKWSVAQAARNQIRKGCIDIIRTRRGSRPAARARALAEALGDPSCELVKKDLTEDEFAQFVDDLRSCAVG